MLIIVGILLLQYFIATAVNANFIEFRNTSLQCSNEESLFLSNSFRKSGRLGRDASYCPNELWLNEMQESNIKVGRGTGVFINIGFNKGYNFANWMNIFLSWSTMTPSIWHTQMSSLLVTGEDTCGFCNDCSVVFNKQKGPTNESEFVFVGIDINMINIEVVSKVLHCSSINYLEEGLLFLTLWAANVCN